MSLSPVANACGTFALLHALANSGVELGMSGRWKRDTQLAAHRLTSHYLRSGRTTQDAIRTSKTLGEWQVNSSTVREKARARPEVLAVPLVLWLPGVSVQIAALT